MHPFWFKVLFHRPGKPRAWTRVVIFRKDRTARPFFYPVVHKKNGAVRQHWSYWAANSSTHNAISQAVEDGKPPPNPFDAERLRATEHVLSQLRTFDQTIASMQRTMQLPKLLSVEAIFDQLASSATSGVVLSASHDNYRLISGGVQLCIQREEQAAIARGLAYLQFHPWRTLPCLSPVGEEGDLPVTILLNGTPIGSATMAALTAAVARYVSAGREARLVVHHLLGHSPEALATLAHATQAREVPFWLHDFFTLCPSYTLQRNGLAFCGAPSVKSNACGLCVFGVARSGHQARITAFFEALPIVAVAPSQVTADFWSAKSGLPVRELTVIPHVVLDEQPRSIPAPIDAGASITVGFLGATVAHKGWSVFTEMMNRFSGQKIRFVVFSTKCPGQGEDEWQRVHVTTETPDAMVRAVARSKVDVVLHWPTWPETFSFTTFEALLAGAWVLTNPVAGNVQAAVRTSGRGAVLEDQAALVRLFSGGGLAKLVAERRALVARTEIAAQYSSLSFDLPGWS